MQYFNSLTIGKKLITAFSTIILMTAFVGLFSNFQMEKVYKNADVVADDNLPSVAGLLELEEHLSEITSHWFEHILSTDKADMESTEKDLEQHIVKFRELHKVLLKFMDTPQEKKNYEEFTKSSNKCFDINSKLLNLSKAGNKTGAFNLYRLEGKSECAGAGGFIQKLVDINKKQAADQIKTAENVFNSSCLINYISIAFIVLASIALAITTASSVTGPISEVVSAADRIAKGDFDIKIHSNNNNETGLLLRTIGQMATDLGARDKTIQQQSLSIIELSTPVILLTNNILLLPLVGIIDAARAQQFTERLLDAIVKYEAVVTIIDVTGVPTFDNEVAKHITQTIDATQLLGTQIVITGITTKAAMTMTELGIRFANSTCSVTLSAGVAKALELVGRRIETDKGVA